MTKDSNQSATMKNNNDKEKKMKKFNRSATMKNNNEKEKMMKEFKRSATMKSSNNKKEKMPTRNPLRAISATEFKRKAQQLGQQTYELATLCDILACLVIQKPDDDDDKVYTWPNSMDEVKRVVGVYNAAVANGNRPTVQVSKPDERSMELLTANERRMLVSTLDAKIDDLKAGWGKRDSCDEAGIGGGHGFAPFLVDERLKKLTAAQIKDLVSELDSRSNL